MKKTALITGASGGIGRALCHESATDGIDLVLVSRNTDALEKLAGELTEKYGISAKTISKDLSAEGSAKELYSEISEAGISIDYLVNNAGFGDFGKFLERPLEKYEKMMMLNMNSLTILTHMFAKDMLERGYGKVLNVASMVAFQAGPCWSVYSASKAYVLSLTEALSNEYKESGVTFTALCPGPTKTNFEGLAESADSKMFSRIGNMTAEDVAEYGYKMMKKGKVIAVPGLVNRMMSVVSTISPRRLSRWVYEKIQ